jgi:ribosomal protein L11 methyltransferase
MLAAIVLEVHGLEAETFSEALLDCGALSVTCEDAHAAAVGTDTSDVPEGAAWPIVRLTALCESERKAEEVLRRACAASQVTVQVHELGRIPNEDWVAKSKMDFGPIRVSSRLWIVPSWHTAPDPNAVNLVLDPGLAFGTGGHATTRLCLRWLENRVVGGETVLDYGCGSGILAIAALKLGASSSVGVDIDPDAVAAARENALRNSVPAVFLESSPPSTFAADLVVANILLNPLKVLAPILARRCRHGGHVALSGILARQAAEVQECYAPWIALAASEEEEGWVCLSGVKQ